MTPRRRLPKILRIVAARPRLFCCALAGLGACLLAPPHWREVTRGLIGWNIAVWAYLAAAGVMILRSQGQDIRRRAALQDEGRYAILSLALVASTISFGAIFAELAISKTDPPELRGLHIGLALATIFGSWLFVHMTFALHYAHEYFGVARADSEGHWRGGIEFPGAEKPDYFDFLYFAYVIGVACATADTNISGRSLRRLATLHGILSFFYNNAVLAMTINIGAGFVGS